MPILSKCVGNFLSVYNADSPKTQVGNYIKGKIVARKIVLMIHMTNLESS